MLRNYNFLGQSHAKLNHRYTILLLIGFNGAASKKTTCTVIQVCPTMAY